MNKCIKCGSCCGSLVPITLSEKEKIEEYIKRNNIIPAKKCFLEKLIDCKFLGDDNQCMIYEVRPSICRNYQCGKDFSELHLLDVHKNKYKYFIKDIK
ncbi:MAG: YkgJ family cysteine cluster protein [Clostridiales bacterium]